ncbi:MAG: hypothetical protein M5R36_25695 [Deltaproteobacteria bacterium]|nr:hypothetical protein [Deltaproteobacteria bacterium]
MRWIPFLLLVLAVAASACLQSRGDGDDDDAVDPFGGGDDDGDVDQDCVDALTALNDDCVVFYDTGGHAMTPEQIARGCGTDRVDCYVDCYDPKQTCVEMYACLTDDCGLDEV